MTDSLGGNVRRLPVARAGDLFTGSPEALFEALSAASPDGFLITSADGRLLAASDRLLELWRLSPCERAELRALGATAAAQRALLHALQRRAVCDLGSYRTPEPGAVRVDEVALRDGRVLERRAAPTFGSDGAPTGWIVVFHDVTRRKQDERALEDRVEQEAALAALGELAVNAEDVEPLLVAACATAAELLGADAAALLDVGPSGATIRAVAGLPGELRGAALGGASPPARPGGHLAPLGFAAALEVTLPGREGAVRALGAYARAPRTFSANDERLLSAAASVLASALARADAEQELVARERELRAVFDGARDPMLIVRDDGAIVAANAAAGALFDTRPGGLAGRALDAVAPLAPEAVRAGGWHALLARDRGEAELEGARRRQVEVAVTPGILPGRSLVAVRDVTETRQLRARLALADRLASVGTLAAGVAHELNNPLAYVAANLAFLSERLERLAPGLEGGSRSPPDADLGQLREAVREARDGAERMRAIVGDLRTFSRSGDDEPGGAVELAPVIASCLNVAGPEIRRRARLTRDLAPVPLVHGNTSRLGQVFLNLLVNAAQAIPEGAPERHEVRIVTRARPDGRVAVEVRDTGCGIAPENLARVFDPFFTTKPPGVGTGLGLAICHGIVAGLGGALEVESAPGAGATFRVLLRSAPGEARPGRAPAPSRPPRPRQRVLVVDDEPLVAAVLQRTLQGDHDVVAVGAARAALDALERGERFDVVLCDLLMPGMSGMELHRTLAAAGDPHARRMLFLTGGAFTASTRAFLDATGVECLEKPFELEALRAGMARVAGGAAATL